MTDIQSIKARFGIIGNDDGLNRALETASRVATTDLSVLVTGESGVGKENIPKIIHAYSARKHNKYIAVNCGAIPAGTMDSELFGHVKGSFTGATGERKGYFEEANGGTIFLDEVAEMPMETQVKLLRVLEDGEYIKVGASNIQKTDVRIVAATNVNIPKAIEQGKFREDLYYRLNTVPISLPALRSRSGDVHLLFRKFAYDFAEKYHMPAVRLADDAIAALENYYWPGNIRQLRNITEQLSILETDRNISASRLLTYLPDYSETNFPAPIDVDNPQNMNERELLWKVVFELQNDVSQLKKVLSDMIQGKSDIDQDVSQIQHLLPAGPTDSPLTPAHSYQTNQIVKATTSAENGINHMYYDELDNHEEVVESLSIADKEKELIEKALDKYNGKRRAAAKELGISERTLYRKIKEYELG
jgi:transcriptional regulator with PAS, ATPase and Fis domain